MITDEQIKNLKPGDPLIIHGKFNSIFKDGDIGIEVYLTGGYGDGGDIVKDVMYTHPSYVSLPSVEPIEMSHTAKISEERPKYDPCRKFKEGDIVDYRRRHGRDYETVPDPEDYKLARVISSEDEESGMVGVEFIEAYGGEDVFFAVPWYHLELVTPIEELELYFVGESENSYDLFRKTINGNQLRASFWWRHNPTPDLIELSKANAKAAAEAERDRLNAEHRKENI